MSKVIAITGASSGIGEATARRLASDGHAVVLGARRTERTEALADQLRRGGATASAVPLDVTDRASTEAFAAAALAEHGRVDVWVSNAGIMPLSRLDALLVDEWDQMIDVNVRGLLHSIAAVLPIFTRQGGGHLVSIASVGAFEVSPAAAVYCGTKFAARAIVEGLRLEADPSVRVTTVSPGVVDSELAEHITDPGAAAAMASYRQHAIAPSAVAAAVAFALGQPEDVDVNEVVVRPARQR